MEKNRKLPSDMITALNQLAKQPDSWWYELINDKDVFVALRNGYLNVYVNGGSIARVAWRNGQLTCEVHKEYLTPPVKTPKYHDLANPGGRIPTRSVISDLTKYTKDLGIIKRRTRFFAGAERRDENQIARSVHNVVDMELAYSENTVEHENPELVLKRRRSESGQIDLVIAGPCGRLVFVEIKRYENKELRSRGIPEVCDQLRDYNVWLKLNRSRIVAAYTSTIASLRDLKGAFFRERDLPKDPVKIDPTPRLLIVGYDAPQKAIVEENREYIARLMREHHGIREFTDEHVIALGSASSVKARHLV